MFNRKKFQEHFRQPVLGLDEQGKLEWIANASPYDVLPGDFRNETELTLIAMLARRVLELEKRVE